MNVLVVCVCVWLGTMVTMWSKGRPRTIHLLASKDMRSLMYKVSGKSAGALDLRSVQEIVAGMDAKGHKKGRLVLQRAANPDACFAVIGNR